MTDTYELDVTDAPSPDDETVIERGLAAYNLRMAGYADARPLAVLVRRRGPSAERSVEPMVEGAGHGHEMRRTLIANRARAMRKTMTEPEVMLWSRLRGRSPEKPTFRRQHPFGSLILDFYCPAARLAVEVDGATHWDEAAQAKDEARDRWLTSQGLRISRIPASEIYRDLSQAADSVILRAEALIAADRGGRRPAPSTVGSPLRSADGPPPAASRGR